MLDPGELVRYVHLLSACFGNSFRKLSCRFGCNGVFNILLFNAACSATDRALISEVVSKRSPRTQHKKAGISLGENVYSKLSRVSQNLNYSVFIFAFNSKTGAGDGPPDPSQSASDSTEAGSLRPQTQHLWSGTFTIWPL